jgi:hypothetical protein
MAIRTIPFTVTATGTTPTTAQFAGVQGDDAATDVVFSLDAALIADDYVYRVEYVDGMNGYDTTDIMTLAEGETTITVPLIRAWTQAGGTGEIHLVVSQMDDSAQEQLTLYTLVGRVYFENRNTGTGYISDSTITGLTELINTTESATSQAMTAAEAATSSAEAANSAAHYAEEAEAAYIAFEQQAATYQSEFEAWFDSVKVVFSSVAWLGNSYSGGAYLYTTDE